MPAGSPPHAAEPLGREFYLEPTARAARAMLGHWLLRRVATAGGASTWCGGEIVETEAYLTGDPACHAYVRETPRNRMMWGEPGRAYVFTIYGSYLCLNPVCGPRGVAEAILIRAVRPRFGVAEMLARRPVERERDLLSGPSKLCVAMGVGRDLNGVDLCDASGEIIVARSPERDAFVRASGPIVVCTRIGLTRGADLPLRFYLKGDPNVSRKATAAQVSALEDGF